MGENIKENESSSITFKTLVNLIQLQDSISSTTNKKIPKGYGLHSTAFTQAHF